MILHDNVRDGLLARLLAEDLSLREPVLLEELQYRLYCCSSRNIRRNTETGGAPCFFSAMTASKCACACAIVKPRSVGACSSSSASSIIWSSSTELYSREFGGRSASMQRARLAHQSCTNSAISCRHLGESFFHHPRPVLAIASMVMEGGGVPAEVGRRKMRLRNGMRVSAVASVLYIAGARAGRPLV